MGESEKGRGSRDEKGRGGWEEEVDLEVKGSGWDEESVVVLSEGSRLEVLVEGAKGRDSDAVGREEEEAEGAGGGGGEANGEPDPGERESSGSGVGELNDDASARR